MGAEGNTAASRGGRRLVLTIGFLAILAAGAAVYWYGAKGPRPAHAARAAARPGVPVSVAIVGRQDVPVYLTGLGTVQASFTVGIHSQVDGKLQEVLFTEGQHAKKGDVLAKIDPRLFQAALDQARAKKAQDQALFEKEYLRPIWARALEEAEVFRGRRQGLQDTLDRLRGGKTK